MQPTLNNLHPNEYNQNYTTIHFRLNQIGVLEVVVLSMTYLMKYVFQIKKKDLNIHVSNMITGKNESKILTKHVLCKCKCKFDGRK